jgi:hypothetical protein
MEKDDEKIEDISKVIERIKKVKMRMLKKKCGDRWSGKNYESGELNNYVKRMGVK